MSQHRQEMTSAQQRIIVHNIAADWTEARARQGIHRHQGAERSAGRKKSRSGIILINKNCYVLVSCSDLDCHQTS